MPSPSTSAGVGTTTTTTATTTSPSKLRSLSRSATSSSHHAKDTGGDDDKEEARKGKVRKKKTSRESDEDEDEDESVASKSSSSTNLQHATSAVAMRSKPETPASTPAAAEVATTAHVQPRKLSAVAALIRSFSPRSRAKAKAEEEEKAQEKDKDGTVTPSTEPQKKPKPSTFGKLKRSSLSFPASPRAAPAQQQEQEQDAVPTDRRASGHATKTPTAASASKWKQAVHTVARDANRLRIQIPPPVSPGGSSPKQEQRGRRGSSSSSGSHSNSSSNSHSHSNPSPPVDAVFSTGPGSFVDDVRTTLDKLVTSLDAIDPRKLSSIRLGGELRGLVGKAQDEFAAYETTFRDHAAKVGVSIALQNFAASLHQVFPIVERLQTAKFLLNRQFKQDVTFAFQEINSYYTSMFIELSMSVAQTAGLVLPLPSPVKPPPVEVEAEIEEEEDKPVVEKTPPAPTSADICLEGDRHFFGHGCQVDLSRALELYKQAASMENAIAMRSLGHMYMLGTGVEKDLFVGEKWLTQASTHGDTEAFYLLGCLLNDKALCQKTDQLKRDFFTQAKTPFSFAAERGHRDAQFQLAVLLERGSASGIGTGDDKSDRIRSSLPWYRRAAEQRHTKAEAALGRLLLATAAERGDAAAEAIHWLQRAAAAPAEDVDALTLLGVVFATGKHGVKKDVDRGISFFQRAVRRGSCEAMLHLARLLLSASGGGGQPGNKNPRDDSYDDASSSSSSSSVPLQDREGNHDEALRLLLNAAHGGIHEAFYDVGELLYGSPLLRDRAAALRFFIKAAQSLPPHALAAKRAANMVYAGVGCKTVDKWQAHRLYTIAADAGDPEALNALGLMYEDGDGCDLGFVQAAACYRRAVQVGSAHAHFNLGCLLAHGKGVPRNLEAAQANFQQAVALGYALARDFLRPES